MKKSIIILLLLVLGGGYYFYHKNNKPQNELDQLGIHGSDQDRYIDKNKSANSENLNPQGDEREYVANTCAICGNKFSGRGYEEVANGDWQQCKEPYQTAICSKMCGQIHTKKMNELVNQTNNDKPDGKIYEKDACTMCKGTGIEKNTSHLTSEYGRKCPMCDGKGVKSY